MGFSATLRIAERPVKMIKEREALSVTQVNLYVKDLLEHNDILCDILVKGEISNFKLHSSGHMYLSLKDESGVIRAVMFRSAAAKLTFVPENGMKIIARGRVSVYERDGQYQLYITGMQQEGKGDLYAAFERLKEKLSKDGLFDAGHKKPIPKYPKKIGVVTAPTGAAVRDIINVLSRRFLYADIVLFPVLVQGENAAESVANAIKYFNLSNGADVLIVGRGGGSIEDLWAFNEEIVARAVYDSNIPVISAVGHETDFTIIDFVADLRAPTPSAAAELAVPSQTELEEKFNNVYRTLLRQAHNILERKRLLLDRCADRTVLKNPMSRIDGSRQYLDSLFYKLQTSARAVLNEKKMKLAKRSTGLDALSPLGTLARGYSYVTGDGGVIKSAKNVHAGDKVDIVLSDGRFSAIADEVEINTEGI